MGDKSPVTRENTDFAVTNAQLLRTAGSGIQVEGIRLTGNPEEDAPAILRELQDKPMQYYDDAQGRLGGPVVARTHAERVRIYLIEGVLNWIRGSYNG